MTFKKGAGPSVNLPREGLDIKCHLKVRVLRKLLRQAIPTLKMPEDNGKDRRRDLAIMIGLALDGMDAGLENKG